MKEPEVGDSSWEQTQPWPPGPLAPHLLFHLLCTCHAPLLASDNGGFLELTAGTVVVTQALGARAELSLQRRPGLQSAAHGGAVADGVAVGLNCNKNVI